MDIKNFIAHVKLEAERVKSINRGVILFGTMSMGQMARYAMESYGIKADCFCDNHPSRQGKCISGLPVMSPKDAASQYPADCFIICSFNQQNIQKIRLQLQEMGIERPIFDSIPVLYLYWFELKKRPADAGKYLASLYSPDSSRKVLKLKNLGLIVTERCTLRCRDCGSLMTYFQSPKDYPAAECIHYLKRLSGLVDSIENLGVYGGEPFLYRDLLFVLEEALKLENIRNVNIITNGTMVPGVSVLKGLSELGILVSISDYGAASGNIKDLCAALDDYRIVYEIIESEAIWYRALPPKKFNRTYAENQRLFQECFIARRCPILQRGKLYLCGYHASAQAAGLYPDDTAQCLDLSDRGITADEIRHLFEVKEMDICDYCLLALKVHTERGAQIENDYR